MPNPEIFALMAKARSLPQRESTVLNDEFFEELLSLNRPSVLLITGGEQVGKTTILKSIFSDLNHLADLQHYSGVLILLYGSKVQTVRREESGMPILEITLPDTRLRAVTIIEVPMVVGAKPWLRKADRCLFVTYAAKPLPRYEIDFVKEHLQHIRQDRIIYTLHKADHSGSIQDLLAWIQEIKIGLGIFSEVTISSVLEKSSMDGLKKQIEPILSSPVGYQEQFHRFLFGLSSGVLTLELKLATLKTKKEGCGHSETELSEKLETLQKKQEYLRYSFMAFSEGLEQEFSEHMQTLSQRLTLERQLIFGIVEKSIEQKFSLSELGVEFPWILRYAVEKHKSEIQVLMMDTIGKIRESTLSLCQILAKKVHIQLDLPLEAIRKLLDASVQEMVNDWIQFTHQELEKLVLKLPELKNTKNWKSVISSQKQILEKKAALMQELNDLLSECFTVIELSLRHRFLPAAEAIWKKLAKELQSHTESMHHEVESLLHTKARQAEISAELDKKSQHLKSSLQQWKNLAQLAQSHCNGL